MRGCAVMDISVPGVTADLKIDFGRDKACNLHVAQRPLTKGVLFAPKGVLFAPSDIDVTGNVRKSRGSIGGKTIINPQEETMKTHVLLALVGLATGFITPAFTQTTIPKELVGTWTMVSITQEQDGKQTDLFGPNPQGRRIIDADGHVFYIITRGDLPKFASNNRAAGTPEENKAVVQGSIAYFGTITVNEVDKTYTQHIEVCTYPNWVGIERKGSYTINGDELITLGSGSSVGEGTVRVVYKRAK